MKAEEISNAVGRLDEEMILPVQEERGEGKKRKRKAKRPFWISLAAAAACIGLIGGIVLTNGNPGDSGKNSVYAAELASPQYPEMAKYPDELSCIGSDGTYDSDKFDKMYEPWKKQREERLSAAEELRVPDRFFKSTINEFLSGAGSDNRVYSPVNVYMALAMLAETTDGDSRAQILELLGADSIEELRKQAANMWRANYRDDGATTSVLANSIWLNSGISYRQKTLDTLAKDYYAASFHGDPASEEMTALLRKWINEQTKGLLEKEADGVKLSPQTVLALCSTVYFSAKWQDTFQESNNDRKTFHAPGSDIQSEFMNDTMDSGTYYTGEGYGAISLPFEDGGRMWLILPDEGKTVDNLLASGEYLDMAGRAQDWENRRTNLMIHYSVPKFDVSSKTNLKDGLQALGVTDVFDETKSDFSPLTRDADHLYVSTAEHAARVLIDEEGCTAAAFTVIAVDETGALVPEDEIEFILDRPFLFVVTSDAGQPLFTGVVNQP